MSSLGDIGGMRLALVGSAVITLPLVVFAKMEPEGIGVMTAYVVPSLVVILFFVLLLDALMNRVFMIEQADDIRTVRRRRMWLDLAAAGLLLLIWGSYFRTLLEP